MSKLVKTFFYPVLQSMTRDFIDGSVFEVELSGRLTQSNQKENLDIDYKVNLKSAGIEEYISKGFARVFLDVYSKETITRIFSPLENSAGTLEFEAGKLIGSIELQPFIASTKDISSYRPIGVNKEYGDMGFDVPAGSILAIGEKILMPLSFKRIKLESMIRVQKSEDIDPDSFSVNLESHVITILMGSSFHSLWDIMRSDQAVRPYLFLSVYKDTFVEALSLINRTEDVEEYAWAQALITKCENSGIKIEDLNDFSSQNTAALMLLREFGVHKLLASEV
jgi:hypothetical protein